MFGMAFSESMPFLVRMKARIIWESFSRVNARGCKTNPNLPRSLCLAKLPGKSTEELEEIMANVILKLQAINKVVTPVLTEAVAISWGHVVELLKPTTTEKTQQALAASRKSGAM